MRILAALGRIILRFLLAILIVWGAAALWFDGPAAHWLAGTLAVLFGAGALAWLFLKPFRIAAGGALAAWLLLLVWWLSIPARNDRDWVPEVARLARATIAGSTVTIENVRDFEYRSDSDVSERWETRTYDLDGVIGCDLYLCFWGPTLYAHTITSWEFADGSHLAISIETRKERGESYSAVRGFFRQFELYYVVADERDVIGLRAGPRGERVYLYRLTIEPRMARALLLDYLREINRLHESPRWYNALTHNCTVAIRYHMKHVATVRRFDWRMLLNGYLDELMWERGAVERSGSFADFKRRSDISEAARAALGHAEFSRAIRATLAKPLPR